ncbi:MAG: hypothetical protein ACJ8F7_07025 [Gemmataceae bacterium]
MIGHPHAGPMVPIFTDEDLSRRFIEDFNGPRDVQPLALPSPQALLAVLGYQLNNGAKFVGVDYNFKRDSAQLHEIREFIGDVNRGAK